MALTMAIFESANSTLITALAQMSTNNNDPNNDPNNDLNEDLNEDHYGSIEEDEGGRKGNKFGFVVIFTGFSLGLFLTCFLLICCKFFAKKPVRYGSANIPNGDRSTRDHKNKVVIERQTTTSDEFNPDCYSYYYDDSTNSQIGTESDVKERERKYEKIHEKKYEERIEMSNLKGSSAHHHKCPHYVDVHKPSSSSSSRLPHPEPRREIGREDIIIAREQKGSGQVNGTGSTESGQMNGTGSTESGQMNGAGSTESGQVNGAGSIESGQAQESVVDTIGTISDESALKGQKNSPSDGSKTVAGETHEVKTSVRLFIKQDAQKRGGRNQRSMSTTVQSSTSGIVSTTEHIPKATRKKSHSLSGESHCSSKLDSSLDRQESIDAPDESEQSQKNRKMLSIIKGADSIESSGSDRSPETVRKQYKELWSLRASYAESEENRITEEGASDKSVEGGGATSSDKKEEKKLEKLAGDSGYKSMEIMKTRKDYSIDMKTEEIYRQFTESSSSDSTEMETMKERKLLSSSTHPSIEETNEDEDEEDMVEIFF